MLWRLLRRFLFFFPPELAHWASHIVFRLLGVPAVARRIRPRAQPSLAIRCLGLEFDNPLGLAAGFDKGEITVGGVFAVGFGHAEIGTVTPRPQSGNPKPRLFRMPEHRAIVNRMGFNNEGAARCAARMARLPTQAKLGILGVNIGKNRDTPNERAEEDYLACIDVLHPHADFLVVNISSPNTPGLRELQAKEPLERILRACAGRIGALPHPRPLLVKLAPDLDDETLDDAVEAAIACGVSGIVAANTTIQRPGPTALHRVAKEAGGLSGAPLEPLATAVVRRVYARVKGRVPIIGVGGVMGPEDAYAKIRAGASLVQAYTGLIYAGPTFARQVLGGLAGLLRRDGFERVEDAVGADHRAGPE
jgi:dihydroorotate dehydrogenase